MNFEQSVELTFRPNPSIRETDSRKLLHWRAAGDAACRGPTTARAAFDSRDRFVSRCRAISSAHDESRRLATFARDRKWRGPVTLRATNDGWANEELEIAKDADINFENATEDEQLFILERTAWSDDAATAAEVTALQVFRDLFASEALRPGEQISVGTLTVLFTDLKDSTRMYREIGDATAFGRVMNHFDILKQAIADEDGALVKTIGDAVMAVFRSPAGAVRAMLHAQQRLASPPEGMQPLSLKAGLHTGPCIAVTLNDRLDYFGSTVNLAARLEGQSTGDDVVISTAVYSDPEVRELLGDPEQGLFGHAV